MPLYEFKCGVCQSRVETYRKVTDYDLPEICSCGAEMSKVLSAAQVFVQAEVHYTCPITGEPITSRKAHEENLAKHGCRVLESGEKEEYQRRLANEDTQLEKTIEQTAETFVESLTPEAREQLGRELDSGLDCTVIRQ